MTGGAVLANSIAIVAPPNPYQPPSYVEEPKRQHRPPWSGVIMLLLIAVVWPAAILFCIVQALIVQ